MIALSKVAPTSGRQDAIAGLSRPGDVIPPEMMERFSQSMLSAIEQKSLQSSNSKPKLSQLIKVSSQEEHERQAKTLAAFVQSMTDEFMSSYRFMN
jgi:hypothetical protein